MYHVLAENHLHRITFQVPVVVQINWITKHGTTLAAYRTNFFFPFMLRRLLHFVLVTFRDSFLAGGELLSNSLPSKSRFLAWAGDFAHGGATDLAQEVLPDVAGLTNQIFQ
jgi:hypothetical protein